MKIFCFCLFSPPQKFCHWNLANPFVDDTWAGTEWRWFFH